MTTRNLIDELVAAWEVNDAYRASAFFAENGSYHESGRAPHVGREAILAHFRKFFRDGPPWKFEVDEVIAEGDRAAIAYRFAVKTATGEWTERAGCAIVRRSGGLIEYWREFG